MENSVEAPPFTALNMLCYSHVSEQRHSACALCFRLQLLLILETRKIQDVQANSEVFVYLIEVSLVKLSD